MKLVKYRDAGMNTYTYFWVRDTGGTISPFFDSEKEAQEWTEYKLATLEEAKEFAIKRNYKFEEND
jgi:hypothetical protein